MSLLSIPARIFGFAKSAVKKLPGMKALRSKSDPDDKIRDLYKVKINTFTQAQIGDDKLTFDLAPKLRDCLSRVESDNPNIEDGQEDFRRIIEEHITPVALDGKQKVQYNERALEDDCNSFVNEREQDYIRRIEEIRTRHSQTNSINFSDYNEVFNNFFTESLTLLINLNNSIFERLVNFDDFKSSDLDLAQGFKQTRNITSSLSTKILNDFLMLLSQLPGQPEEDAKLYIEQIKQEFRSPIKTLFQSSHFGILDRDIVETFMMHYLEKINNTKLDDDDLKIIQEFQEGIHGCLLLKDQISGTEIASLDLRFAQSTIKDLNESIMKLTRNQGDKKTQLKRRKEAQHRIIDLINYTAATGSVERRINERVEAFSNDESSIQLGIPRQEVLNIENSYKKIFKIENFVGRTKDDKINEENFPQEALLNSFVAGPTAKDSSIIGREFSKNYERLVLEASLLAGYHALAEFSNEITPKQREDLFKSKELLNFDAEEHVPWLKGFYEHELEKYRKIIANDPSPRKTADLALTMCKICQRLASPAIDIYQSNDVFQRYLLNDIAENAIARVGRMTDINHMSLALKIYSEIFSNLEKDALAAGLTKEETKWLSRHVEFLKQKSQIYDDKGKPLYAPADGNPYEQAKFDELQEHFKKSGIVDYNLDLILKYFKNAVIQKRVERKSQEKYSDLGSRNLLLSSALLYYYLKFMPEKSDSVQSLKEREKIIETLFDPALGSTKNLPKELGPKILDHLYGTESDTDGNPTNKADYERGGFIRSYALELQEKLDTFAEGKNFKNIELQDVLNLYYRLETIKTRNLKDEYERYPENIGKDVTSFKDEDHLFLWSKQVRRDKLFHGGKDRDLLPPLKDKLKPLLKNNSSDVLKFIRGLPEGEMKKELAKEVAKELFKMVANNAENVLKFKHKDIIEIRDTNKYIIDTTVDLLGNLARISNLIYDGNKSSYNVSENSILGEDNRQEFLDRLDRTKQVLKSRFLLVDSENKSGADVKQSKQTLATLLRAFKVKPAISNHLEWMPESRILAFASKSQAEKANSYSIAA
jgi:hypothetical protein